MNEIVAEWVAKAEGDFTTASREWRARKNRSPYMMHWSRAF